ncbi:thiamine monophosphate kinase [Chondrocystis sp. NIES-4102]|nr:thiamine monophosphate kinase [Chondrocystis sp. NIES-4102]
MNNEPLLVKDLGEQGLLEIIQQFCPQDVVGDDAAILDIEPGKSLVVTTDVLVDGVHFSDRTTTAYDVGWRATAANLSDLAAMGATPIGITIGLSLPKNLPVSWVENLYQGIDAILRIYGGAIVGGDVCRSDVISVAITALGEVDPNRAIRRSIAQPGDVLVITGLHGLSRGGLALLQDPSLGDKLLPNERAQLIEAHQRPRPRLDVLPYLAKIPSEIAIAGMDSSDGLASAIAQICRDSHVGAVIEQDKLTIFSGLSKLVGRETAWEWLLYGGEDFELVLSLPPKLATTLVQELGQNASIIGKITKSCDIHFVTPNNTYLEETLNLTKGFGHF